jgi:hypothetical protein
MPPLHSRSGNRLILLAKVAPKHLHCPKIGGVGGNQPRRFGLKNIKVLCAKPTAATLLGYTVHVHKVWQPQTTFRTAMQIVSAVSGSADRRR